ncbi:MAG: RNA polymerase sigma-70 factor [Tannerellaceae bacterium]|jgi:RNA polymerase sigma-70 factor (ECF subfamily)|nr:RNA polymerase sigma-70 factor [Tannerellaceae bacterium]
MKIQNMPEDNLKVVNEDFKYFFLHNFSKVKNFALKILKSEEDAEDIAQDIFVKLWSLPEVWRGKNDIDGYMFIMVRNHIFDFIKQKEIRKNYREEFSPEIETLKSDLNIEEEFFAKELKLAVKVIIHQMPERRREVYLMSRIKGKSNKEIAELLNLSVRTVERHLYLAQLELKKIFS